MPLILRLCLHAVSRDGCKTQVWLSFSLLQNTTAREIVTRARRSVVERMGAALDMSKSYERELALCVRDAEDCYLFLGTAAMEAAAQTPIVKMPFIQRLQQLRTEKRPTSADITEEAWRHFVFVEGALVPLTDLKRLNKRSSTAEKDFTLFEVVEVTPELSRDPVTAEPLGRNKKVTFTASESKQSLVSVAGSDTTTRFNEFRAFSDTTSSCSPPPPLPPPVVVSTETKRTSANQVCVVYVDFAGRQYTTTVSPPDAECLSSLIRASCAGIGSQVGCAFEASKMRLICSMGNSTTHALESNAALHAALKDEAVRFYLAADPRLLESSPPHEPVVSLCTPGLMLRESQDDPGVLPTEAVSDITPMVSTDSAACAAPVAATAVTSTVDAAEGNAGSPWMLATTTVTLRQLATLRPTPSFSACDRQSILRKRNSVSNNMSEEEDNARVRLAAAHFHMDELSRQYFAASRGSVGDAVCNELSKRKAVLTEEWRECMSAERDCERLELLLTWLERDVADGHMRQKNLIRSLYATQ